MAYNPAELDSVYNQYLGRNANQSEYDSLKPYIDQGFISPLQIGQYIQGMPEFQNKQLGQFGQQYSEQLNKNNGTLLDLAKQKISSDFANQGRYQNDPGNASYGSSGFTGAFANAATQLGMQGQSALAGFYGNGYQNIMGNQMNQSQGAIGRAYNLQDQNTQRQWQLSDYNRQQNDYNNYLGGQNTRNFQQGLFSAAINLPGQALGAAGKFYGAHQPGS